MNKRGLFISAAICAGLATPGFAQALLDRAGQASSGLGGTFTQGAIENVVIPYETTTPPEISIPHTGFEEAIRDIRSGGGGPTKVTNGQLPNPQTRVLKATEDSYTIRPDIEIDGQGPLFDDANFAHTNADKIAGKYFSGETGECTTTQLPVSELRDEFCESVPKRINRQCTVTRRIWVDRTDEYFCDRRAKNFVKLCEKKPRYSCKLNSSKSACFKNQTRFPGASSVSWSGSYATVTFRGRSKGPDTKKYKSKRRAILGKYDVRIEVSDRFRPTAVILREVSGNGAMQVMGSNGRPALTVAGRPLSGFGTNPLFGGKNPAKNPNEGLLVPHTHLKSGKRYALIAKYKLSRPTPAWCTIFQSPFETKSVFSLGWDYSNGSIDQTFCNVATDPGQSSFWHHPYYATIHTKATYKKATYQTIKVTGFSTANPTAGRKFKYGGGFKARSVYDSALGSRAAVSFKIQFDGYCCDSFQDVGSEKCE